MTPEDKGPTPAQRMAIAYRRHAHPSLHMLQVFQRSESVAFCYKHDQSISMADWGLMWDAIDAYVDMEDGK